MKRTTLLHAELSRLIASLGHGDTVVLGDAGLPVPRGTPVIDLAVMRGVPTLAQVLKAVLSEMQVEAATIAREAVDGHDAQARPAWYPASLPTPRCLPHEDFKRACAQARAVVRTGEATPYANVILQAGVLF